MSRYHGKQEEEEELTTASLLQRSEEEAREMQRRREEAKRQSSVVGQPHAVKLESGAPPLPKRAPPRANGLKPKPPRSTQHPYESMCIRAWINNQQCCFSEALDDLIRDNAISRPIVGVSSAPLAGTHVEQLATFKKLSMRADLQALQKACVCEAYYCQYQLSNVTQMHGNTPQQPESELDLDVATSFAAFYELYNLLWQTPPWSLPEVTAAKQTALEQKLDTIWTQMEKIRDHFVASSVPERRIPASANYRTTLTDLSNQLMQLSQFMEDCISASLPAPSFISRMLRRQ